MVSITDTAVVPKITLPQYSIDDLQEEEDTFLLIMNIKLISKSVSNVPLVPHKFVNLEPVTPSKMHAV